MIERNVFGELEYTLGNLFVPHRKGGTGKYAILKHEPFSVTDPMWLIEPDASFWDTPPLFDSFIHAVRWLKAHEKELV